MDKKFLKTSSLICLPIIILLGIFTICLKDANEYNWSEEKEDYTIKYKDYKETDDTYIVILTFKNNSNNIATVYDLKLSFDYLGQGEDVGEFYIRGQEDRVFDDNYVYGINSGEERDIIFRIPKAIKFNEEKYNTKSMNIDCTVDYFKIRRNNNSLLFRVISTGSTITVGGETNN